MQTPSPFLLSALALATSPAFAQEVPLVNAPVAPDALFLVRGTSTPSLSVLDLNGFGQSTGDPTFDPIQPTAEGNSNYPNNPNVLLQGNVLVPPLAPGTSTLDGGSAGVFTLTLDTALDSRHLRNGELLSIADVALGGPLDVVYNAGPPPFGCQAGTPNLCGSTGLKVPMPMLSPIDTAVPMSPPTGVSPVPPGYGNLISWAPHPNPPPLLAVPTCVDPDIRGQEPTSIDSGVPNLLVPGPNSVIQPGQTAPPSNLLAQQQNTYFVGPSLPQPSLAACNIFQLRQQIGHFGFVADPSADEVVVVNSNRMTVLARIAVEGPTAVAMSPNLDLLAVASETTGVLTFVDTNPASVTFLAVIKELQLVPGLADLVFQPDAEQLLVVSEQSHELGIVDLATLELSNVLSTIGVGVRAPFRISITNRQTAFGNQREVYYAFVLGRNGRLAVYESGPTAFGSNTLLATDAPRFARPTDMQLDPSAVGGQVWIAHQNPIDGQTGQPIQGGGGALTAVRLEAGTLGVVVPTGGETTLADRDLSLSIDGSIDESQLTGIPTSIAFDEQVNLGALAAPFSAFAPKAPIPANSKSPVRAGGAATRRSQFLFVTVPASSEGPGVVDVIEYQSATGTAALRFDTNPYQDGTQSIPAPGVRQVIDWFGQ
ncbi:MAG: hypothetical protein AAFZ65_13130 [Planctomycetota bacterium]